MERVIKQPITFDPNNYGIPVGKGFFNKGSKISTANRSTVNNWHAASKKSATTASQSSNQGFLGMISKLFEMLGMKAVKMGESRLAAA